eukprot:TRINITY_DN1524_c1_g2_i3.p1 TRINITY_DN1524_c1_g2~~TRINITY_DN1524_c1_g2_i3.p1  ORF type:complete len:324 (+),score=66.45 TRINITY_DN1524_c1_g2_i3:478-1449(+)
MVWSSNYLQKKFIKSKTMVPLDPTKRGGGYSLTMALPEGSYDFTIIDDNETPITLFRDRQCEVYDNIAFYRMEVGEGPMFSTPEEKRRGGSDIASDSSLLDLKERLLEIGEKYCGICRVSGKEEQCVFEVLEHVEKMFQRSPSPRRGASYHKPEMVLDDVSYSEAYDESSITAGDGHDLVRRINLLNGRFLGGGEGSAMDIIIKTERRLKTLEGYVSPEAIAAFVRVAYGVQKYSEFASSGTRGSLGNLGKVMATQRGVLAKFLDADRVSESEIGEISPMPPGKLWPEFFRRMYEIRRPEWEARKNMCILGIHFATYLAREVA